MQVAATSRMVDQPEVDRKRAWRRTMAISSKPTSGPEWFPVRYPCPGATRCLTTALAVPKRREGKKAWKSF